MEVESILSGLGSTINLPHSIAQRRSRSERYMFPHARWPLYQRAGPQVHDLTVRKRDKKAAVSLRLDDPSSDEPVEYLSHRRLALLQSSAVTGPEVLSRRDPVVAAGKREHALVGEAPARNLARRRFEPATTHL